MTRSLRCFSEAARCNGAGRRVMMWRVRRAALQHHALVPRAPR